MLDENAATTRRPWAAVKISSNASTTSTSEPVKPRRSILVLSAKSASTPAEPSSREARDVEMLAVERRLIDLEVAGVDDDARRRVNRQADAVRNAVCDANELDVEGADRHPLRRSQRGQPGAGHVNPVFDQLGLDQRERQRRAVDGAVDVGQQVRNRADVILVAVRQHERRGPCLLLQIRQIRNDQIHAEQFGIREHDASVHDDGRVAPGEREHVHAELAEAAE